MKKLWSFHPDRLSRAFSLVEVTIALGVTAFAVLSVAGMLPVGLGTLRDSKTQMLETQILRQVASQNAVGSFTNITFTALFDGEGRVVAKDALYRVVVSEASGPPVYPGSSNAFQLANSLKAACVEITDLRTQTAKTNFLWLPQAGK